ncbi:hypothetical protein MAH4_00550 [Sessilibacter sp. MAH4]
MFCDQKTSSQIGQESFRNNKSSFGKRLNWLSSETLNRITSSSYALILKFNSPVSKPAKYKN